MVAVLWRFPDFFLGTWQPGEGQIQLLGSNASFFVYWLGSHLTNLVLSAQLKFLKTLKKKKRNRVLGSGHFRDPKRQYRVWDLSCQENLE